MKLQIIEFCKSSKDKTIIGIVSNDRSSAGEIVEKHSNENRKNFTLTLEKTGGEDSRFTQKGVSRYSILLNEKFFKGDTWYEIYEFEAPEKGIIFNENEA